MRPSRLITLGSPDVHGAEEGMTTTLIEAIVGPIVKKISWEPPGLYPPLRSGPNFSQFKILAASLFGKAKITSIACLSCYRWPLLLKVISIRGTGKGLQLFNSDILGKGSPANLRCWVQIYC